MQNLILGMITSEHEHRQQLGEYRKRISGRKEALEEEDAVQSDFNEFILGANYANQGLEEKVLSKNLLALNKHARMGVKVCQLKLAGASSEIRQHKLEKAVSAAEDELRN